VKHGLLDDAAVAQVFDDDAFEECGRDTGVPDAFRIHDHDRATGANTQTWRFAALHAARAEEQTFALE
jgi:hypothetical protein